MESLEYFRSSTRWSLNWHPLFFQNWFKGHWDTLPEPPSIGRSKQWFSSKFDFNQTIEFSWSSFLVMITNPISAGIPQARKCGSLWIARVKWCEIPSFAGNYTILYQVFAFEYPQFCNVLLWNLHHVIYLINFHSPPPVAIQRLHLRVLPGNLGVDSDVPSAMWKCYEMLWNAMKCWLYSSPKFIKHHRHRHQGQCRDGNPPYECPQPLHARQAESVLKSQLPAGAPIRFPKCFMIQSIYNPSTIWIIWFLCKYLK
jgi:hypothetical protein